MLISHNTTFEHIKLYNSPDQVAVNLKEWKKTN